MTLLGWTFLVSAALFVVDLGTLFGRVFSSRAPVLRGSGMVAATILSAVALVQGHRAPVVTSFEVTLPSLRAELDGTVLVAVSDAHLGNQLGGRWFAERLREIEALRPDAVLFLGDMFEGHGDVALEIAALRRLSVPLGKWFVDGNHEVYRGRVAGGDPLEQGGCQRLENQWTELTPGLVLAGVQDLTMHRFLRLPGDPLDQALANRPSGTTVLLSHSPLEVDRAARAGVDLMLSGHTHGGQIWPFGYMVQIAYPHLAGRYDVDGMTVIVSRGTGTWGPRMRLWHRAEIVKVTLRRSPASHESAGR
jgi:predicted MPP superfamily phosphohydrolase